MLCLHGFVVGDTEMHGSLQNLTTAFTELSDILHNYTFLI